MTTKENEGFTPEEDLINKVFDILLYLEKNDRKQVQCDGIDTSTILVIFRRDYSREIEMPAGTLPKIKNTLVTLWKRGLIKRFSDGSWQSNNPQEIVLARIEREKD